MINSHIGRIIQRDHKELIRTGGANSATVIMNWTDLTHPPEYDKHNEDTHTSTKTPRTEEFQALIHSTNYQTSGYQRFAEIQTGDLILDIPHDQDLPQATDVTFTIQGQTYTQKTASKELAESWDTTIGGTVTCKTILLTRKM